MWQVFLIIVFATVGSFCLEIIPKARFTSKKSKAARHFGRLDIESGTKLILSINKESDATNPLEYLEGYQSDQPASPAWHELVALKLSQLNLTVHCGDDSMTLRVQGSNMPNFMIDGVPLTQIPENCGFSFTRGPSHAAFTVPYQGCYVAQQGDNHVLPLRLWGIAMKMSCPLTPNVSCLSSGMVTKLGCNSADVLKLKVKGKWDPFLPASRTCGITTESQTDGVVLTAPYQSSCWQIKGDERFLSVLYDNEEFIFSCPESHDQYGHDPNVIMPTDLSTATGPVSDPEQPLSVASSPTTTSTSKYVDMLYPFPEMYSPFSPILYHHKPYGYPWAFPQKSPTTAPTTTTPQITATTSTTVARNPEQPQYPYPQMYYPYRPMPHGYPWAFPPKAPTFAPTTTSQTTCSTATTSQTTAATSITVARNPEQPQNPYPQMYYPYRPMLYHHKPRPHGYPWAFPPKTPTISPTTTATTSSTVASDPKQPQYPFPPMHYPMPFQKPVPYRYPWMLPSKILTIASTTTPATISPTTATTLDSVASDTYQSGYPFHHTHSLFGPMHCHHGAFPAKVFTTAPITKTTIATPILASNPQIPPYLFNQVYYPFGPKPMPFGYPLPPKAPTTAQRIMANDH